MAVTADGERLGSVSGGCVESAVVMAAQDALRTGRGRTLRFGVSDDDALAVGLACGGELTVLVEPWVDDPAQRALREAVAADVPAASVVRLDEAAIGWRLTLTRSTGENTKEAASSTLGDAAFERGAVAAAADALRERRSGVAAVEGIEVFATTYPPRERLVIVGAVHIAQPLAVMAREAGLHVTVADSRSTLATPERFPGVDRLIIAPPSELIGAADVDSSTSVAVLSHDPKIDDAAAAAALASDARYVGVLGSRSTVAERLERLRRRGVTDEQMARLHAPIGLNLGADSPAEIAVAILADIVATRHGASLGTGGASGTAL